MKKPKKTLVLLVIFTILTLISIITVYAVHQTPEQEITIKTICTYTSTAKYDYTATLEPNNTIYNNKTTLKPNEGILYTKIIKQINIILTYTFDTSVTATATTINYSVTQTLKTTAWQYRIAGTPQTSTNQTQIQITLSPISKTELDPMKTKIDSETGTSTSAYYSLEITPTFKIAADTQAGPIQQTFTPTLTISFKRTEEGDIITIDNLEQTEMGALTENQTTTRWDILDQRYASYILITISITGLFFSTYFYRKTKPTTEKPQIEKLQAQYKDLIIETKETTEPPQTTTINVKTLKELAKTAEILAKPILHATKNGQHIFYIIDNNTKYQYEETQPQPKEPKTDTTTIEPSQP